MTSQPPAGLAARGRKLWREVLALEGVELDPTQLIILAECCRLADRLEQLDRLLRQDVSAWATIEVDDDGRTMELVIDRALGEARQQQNVLKQMLVALRLPDDAGRRPQYRGARGVQNPKAPSVARVSSLELARQSVKGA